MPVRTNTSEEEIDTTSGTDSSFVGSAFSFEVGSIPVEDVDVFLLDIDVAEEVLPHEAVIALRVILRDTNVLVHIEGDDVLEGNTASLMGSYQCTVHAEGRRARRETEDEGLSGGRLSSLNLLDDIVCCPLGNPHIVGLDDKTHKF